MSLTTSDFKDIRQIFRDETTSVVRKEVSDIVEEQVANVVHEEVRSAVSIELQPIKDELEMMRNDIKEIYFIIADLQKSSIIDKTFQKLSIEKRLLTIHAELQIAAKQAGVTLPRT